MEDREESTGGPSQHAYLVESSAETSNERSQSTVEAKRARGEQGRIQSTYCRVFSSHGLVLLAPIKPAVHNF